MSRIRRLIADVYADEGLLKAAFCIALAAYLLANNPQTASAAPTGCGELWDCNIEICQDPLWTCQGYFSGCLITVAECGVNCPGGGDNGLHCVAE